MRVVLAEVTIVAGQLGSELQLTVVSQHACTVTEKIKADVNLLVLDDKPTDDRVLASLLVVNQALHMYLLRLWFTQKHIIIIIIIIIIYSMVLLY